MKTAIFHKMLMQLNKGEDLVGYSRESTTTYQKVVGNSNLACFTLKTESTIPD
jgi:hypothetical protein